MLERRLTITYAVSAVATLCTAGLAIATVFGSPLVQARPGINPGVARVETVDDYVVVPSSATTTAITIATTVMDHAYLATRAPAAVPADTAPDTAVVRAAETSIPVAATISPTTVHPTSTQQRPPTPDQTSDDDYGSPKHKHSDDDDAPDGGEHEVSDD
jgi:hypothetical protein